MIKSLFILNRSGEVLIEKHWRGVTRRDVAEYFWDEVTKYKSTKDVPPVITTPMYYLISVIRHGLFFLACVSSEVAPLEVIELLHRIVDVFEVYMGRVDDSHIQDNFATVYQLLEEVLDNGYPLITEPNTLTSMIPPPSIASRLTAAITGRASVSGSMAAGAMSVIPWRPTAAKHMQNEIFFDVVEEIDAIVDSNGSVVFSNVSGSMSCNCRLSGMPDCTLSFTDTRALSDTSFHPCVRISRYEREKVLSFVPPDGTFQLMKYSVKMHKPLIPMYCKPTVSYHDGAGRLDCVVGTRPFPTKGGGMAGGTASGVTVEGIVVKIRFPKGVTGADVSANFGTVGFPTELQKKAVTCVWTVGRMPADKTPRLTGTVKLAGPKEPESTLTADVRFSVPGQSLSNLRVSKFIVTNEKYNLRKAMRSMIQTGTFEVRG